MHDLVLYMYKWSNEFMSFGDIVHVFEIRALIAIYGTLKQLWTVHLIRSDG